MAKPNRQKPIEIATWRCGHHPSNSARICPGRFVCHQIAGQAGLGQKRITKSTTTFFQCLAFLSVVFAGANLRANGIAVSTDGTNWTDGVGGYGSAWGASGASVSVAQGGTLYIKYYSDAGDVALHVANHGRKWGGWRTIGPVLAHCIGAHPNEPVILKISDIGTSKSTAAWVNGRGKPGVWNGLPAPGSYDLALNGEAQWTRPPIVVTEAQRTAFWSSVVMR
jgi:hypothetical protein